MCRLFISKIRRCRTDTSSHSNINYQLEVDLLKSDMWDESGWYLTNNKLKKKHSPCPKNSLLEHETSPEKQFPCLKRTAGVYAPHDNFISHLWFCCFDRPLLDMSINTTPSFSITESSIASFPMTSNYLSNSLKNAT